MSKILKTYVAEDLFQRIKNGIGNVSNIKSEQYFFPPLVEWYEQCKNDYDITNYNTALCQAITFFNSNISDNKRFEKAVKENGYDLYSLMASVWKEMDLDRTNANLKSSYSEVKRLSAELDRAKNEGFAALAENELSKKVQYLTEALNNETEKNKQLKAALKINTNGGNKMAELTQWEYKVIKQNTSDEEIKNEKQLQELGKQNWEVTGVIPSNSCNTSQVILKRPKQSTPDYGYSR